MSFFNGLSGAAMQGLVIMGFLVIFLLVMVALLVSSIRDHRRYSHSQLPSLVDLGLEERERTQEELDLEEESSIVDADESAFGFAFAASDDDMGDIELEDDSADVLVASARAAQKPEDKKAKKPKKKLFGKRD